MVDAGTLLGVQAVNTMVTVVASALIMGLGPIFQKWLARRYWESISRGRTTDFLVSEGLAGIGEFLWKIRRSSCGDRWRVLRDLLPYAVVIAAFEILPYSTSGVSASAGAAKGEPVTVIGSLSNIPREPIDVLNTTVLGTLQRGEIEGGAAPFLLASPELGNYGTTVTGLDWSLFYPGTPENSRNDLGLTDLSILGSRFGVEQDGPGEGTYATTTCLVVSEDGDAYAVHTCDAVIVELEPHEIIVQGMHRCLWSQNAICEVEQHAIFNRRVTYKNRVLTLDSCEGNFTEEAVVPGMEVTTLCANIFESTIEACIFEVGNHVYVGDWRPVDVDTCSKSNSTDGRDVMIIEFDKFAGVIPSVDEYLAAASMLAEVVAGSGRIDSRHQLALVLGVFSRFAAMKVGVGTAYHPETVVVVAISSVIVWTWCALLVGGLMVYLRERRQEAHVYMPCSTWDWFAVGARKVLRGDDSCSAECPTDSDYGARYGLGRPVSSLGTIMQEVSWTEEQYKYVGGSIGGKMPRGSSKVPFKLGWPQVSGQSIEYRSDEI